MYPDLRHVEVSREQRYSRNISSIFEEMPFTDFVP